MSACLSVIKMYSLTNILMKFGTLDFQNNSKVVVYFSSRNLTPKRWLTLDCENENFFFFVNFCFTFIVTGEVKNRYYYLF